MKKLQTNQKGFTIIEVMIVLVIAAVILLIVFLAVPALQRNSRNTQRKNDVANLLAGMGEYAANHNGNLPDDDQFEDDVLPNVKLGFYTNADIEWTAEPPLGTDNTLATGNEKVWINPYTKCNSDGTAVEGGGTSRQYAALFNLENSAGLNQSQCQAG